MTELHNGKVYFVNDRVLTSGCAVHADVFEIIVDSEISEEQYFHQQMSVCKYPQETAKVSVG